MTIGILKEDFYSDKWVSKEDPDIRKLFDELLEEL